MVSFLFPSEQMDRLSFLALRGDAEVVEEEDDDEDEEEEAEE